MLNLRRLGRIAQGFVLTFVLLSASSAQAQMALDEFQGKSVVANEILVQVEPAATPSLRTSRFAHVSQVRQQSLARVERSLRTGSIERWRIQGDMAETLAKLNRIPGVRAVPNFVLPRPQPERQAVGEIPQVRRVRSENRGLALNLEVEADPAKAERPSRTARYSEMIQQAGERTRLPRLGKANDDVLWEDDLNDPARVAQEWEVFNYSEASGPTVWRYTNEAFDDAADYAFVAGGASGYTNDASTLALSPTFDLTELAGEALFLELGYAAELEAGVFGFWDVFILVLFGPDGEVLDEIDLSSETGMFEYVNVDVSAVAGVSEVSFGFYFESDESVIGGFGVVFDDLVLRLAGDGPDPLLDQLWGLNNDGSLFETAVAGADIDAFTAWEYTTGSREVVVAVMDSGMDITHPDLRANLWTNPAETANGADSDNNGFVDDVNGWNAYESNGNIYDNEGHGTHVSGTIGASGNNSIGVAGVNHQVSIIPIKIGDTEGLPLGAILEGFEYISALLASGVPVVASNHSYGGFSPFGEFTTLVSDLIEAYAADHARYGHVWVYSAGNDAYNNDTSYGADFWAAAAGNVVSVASMNPGDQLSSFSNYGFHTVDLAAPGSAVVSTVPGNRYEQLSGTSMAAPHVTGILALGAAFGTESDAPSKIARLMATATRAQAYQEVTTTGARANAARFLAPRAQGMTGLVPSHETGGIFRLFSRPQGTLSVGFVNATDAVVTVQNIALQGPDAAVFSVMENDRALTVDPDGAYGVTIVFQPDEAAGRIYEASVVLQTSGGSVTIPLSGLDQPMGYPVFADSLIDLGVIAANRSLNGEFTFANAGTGELPYRLVTAIQEIVEEETGTAFRAAFQQPASRPKSRTARTRVIEAVRNAEIPASTRRTVVTPEMLEGNRFPLTFSNSVESRVAFQDDFEDQATSEANWTTSTFGPMDATIWTRTQLNGLRNGNFANLAGNMSDGYSHNTLTVAVTETFNFEALLAEGREQPVRLVFDYAAQLEEDYDFFGVGVLFEGDEATPEDGPSLILGMTDMNLENDGLLRSTALDLSLLTAVQDVRFVFFLYTDESVVDGFGALFDNVALEVAPAPLVMDAYEGVLPAASERVHTFNLDGQYLPLGQYVAVVGAMTDVFLEEEPVMGLFFEIGEATSSGEIEVPTRFDVSSVHPNPSRGNARMLVDLPSAMEVSVTLYDALGRRVATPLIDVPMSAGQAQVSLSAGSLPAGMYLVHLEARGASGTFTASRTVTLLP